MNPLGVHQEKRGGGGIRYRELEQWKLYTYILVQWFTEQIDGSMGHLIEKGDDTWVGGQQNGK